MTGQTEQARSGVQAAIVAVWCEVLGVETVGPHDNFFDLGGNSMRMARVQVELRTALGMELPLAALFEHATVETLTSFATGVATGLDADGSAERVSRQLASRRLRRGRPEAHDG
jgi:acyl carrier protein